MSNYGSRDLTATTNTNLNADIVYPFFAVELIFDSTTIRMWSGIDDLEVPALDGVGSGVTYIGVGSILNISAIEETSELEVKGANITLSGVSDPALSLALSEPYQGRVANIYFGTTSAPTPLNSVFSGYMDQMNISESADTTQIEILVENKLVDLERARVARFTSGYQKSKYPSDLGLDFVEDLQDRETLWGRV
tara:strand:- start:23141 stop:23722 length:582 start_codon:yes stop_codon:yes gene_type:complete